MTVRPRLGRFRGILFVVGLSAAAYLLANVPRLYGLTSPAQFVFDRIGGTGFFAATFALIVGFLVLAIRRGTRLREGFNARVKAEAAAAERRAREMERTRIFNALAHELGNLITPMQLQVKVLQLSPDMAPQVTRSVAIFDRSVGRLSRFLQDLLDLARQQSHQLRLAIQPVDLAALAKTTVAAYQGVGTSRGVHVEFSGPIANAVVPADAGRVEQVLANLLSNALKFTPEGGRVDVAIDAQPNDVVVRVRDTGPGLTQDEVVSLFQPFATLGRQEQGALTGTGLGLFISKTLVGAHGGKIGVESDGVGLGSTFYFSLPRKEHRPPRPEVEASKRSP